MTIILTPPPLPNYTYYSINNTIFRMPDNVFIPMDSNNCDYVNYLLWVKSGNTATSISSTDSILGIAEPVMTPEQSREQNYPTYTQFVEMIYSSMSSGEIPSCSAFVSAVQNVQEAYPITIPITPVSPAQPVPVVPSGS